MEITSRFSFLFFGTQHFELLHDEAPIPLPHAGARSTSLVTLAAMHIVLRELANPWKNP